MAVSRVEPSPEQPVRTSQSAVDFHTARCGYVEQATNPTPVTESAIEWHDLTECPNCERIRAEGEYADIPFQRLRAACRRRGKYDVGMKRGELIAVLRESDFDPEEVVDG